MLDRLDLTKRLVARLKREEAVIGGIGNANFDLYAAGHRPQNFYMLGSMGLACPIAIGVALAQPERGVIALEGDSSIVVSMMAGRFCCPSRSTIRTPRDPTLIRSRFMKGLGTSRGGAPGGRTP